MLYELWQRTVDEHGNFCAVRELAGGHAWTFRELDAAARDREKLRGPICFPQGTTVEFLLATIQGWRQRQVICPLEPGQAPLALDALPVDCVHLKTTSATTGNPRVIAFTANQLVADVDQIVSTMGLRPDWPNLGVISLAHSYGFSSLVLPLLLRGIPLFLVSSGLPEPVRLAAESFGPVTLPAVPTFWRAWHQAGAINPNIRLAISAGAPLPLALESDVFDSVRVKIHNFYGASECGGIAFDSTDEPRQAETCGRGMHGVDVSIDIDGCLTVRSAAVGESYWPESAPNLGGGIYRTSDLAELRGGQIHLLGRATEVINVAGRKVVPESIEQGLLEYPGVESCLVFGVPSGADGRGEFIVALLTVRQIPDSASLRSFLGNRLPAWQVPRSFSIVPNLESNVRGKVSRAEWRRRDPGRGSDHTKAGLNRQSGWRIAIDVERFALLPQPKSPPEVWIQH